LQTIDAILAAGSVPGPPDPLYPLTHGRPKALLEIAGKPMVQWVLEALSAARTIRRVVVVGPGDCPFPSGEGPGVRLICRKPLHFLPAHPSLVENLLAGAQWLAAQESPPRYGLLISCDIPAVTGEAIDWVVETALQTEADAHYAVIERAVMEARFPGARRSYFRLKDGEYSAGDMVLASAALATHQHPLWRQLVEARKSLLRQAQLIGVGMAVRFALGQLTLADGAGRISRRLGLRGRALVCPYAEAGMDVDKPHHYEIMRRELERVVAG
jgi:CTP:molybdopterin cytidylyltransferase MocA